ncbi:MAG: hypothetical protein AB7I38_13395 [Dehalococcoidia bacterium]
MDGTEQSKSSPTGRPLATQIALERHYASDRDAMVAALRVALGWAAQGLARGNNGH